MKPNTKKMPDAQIPKQRLVSNTNMFPTPLATQSAIIVAMRDLLKNAETTLWISDCETVFERLTGLYFHAGGKEKKLKEIFPEYF